MGGGGVLCFSSLKIFNMKTGFHFLYTRVLKGRSSALFQMFSGLHEMFPLGLRHLNS